MNRGQALAAAAGAPLLLLVPLGPPWSWAVVGLSAIWAPGYALLEMVYPRGQCVALERHALASGLGLIVLPVLAVATSATLSFHRWSLVLAILVLVAASAVFAAIRRQRGAIEPAGFAKAPGTRTTLALCGATLLLASIVTWWPQPRAQVPASLWLEGPEGQAFALPGAVPANATVAVTVLVAAGDAALQGTLRLTWDGASNATEVGLGPHGRHAARFVAPTDVVGVHSFQARLEAPGVVREAHFALQVGGA